MAVGTDARSPHFRPCRLAAAGQRSGKTSSMPASSMEVVEGTDAHAIPDITAVDHHPLDPGRDTREREPGIDPIGVLVTLTRDRCGRWPQPPHDRTYLSSCTAPSSPSSRLSRFTACLRIPVGGYFSRQGDAMKNVQCSFCEGTGRNNYGNPCSICGGIGLAAPRTINPK